MKRNIYVILPGEEKNNVEEFEFRLRLITASEYDKILLESQENNIDYLYLIWQVNPTNSITIQSVARMVDLFITLVERSPISSRNKVPP